MSESSIESHVRTFIAANFPLRSTSDPIGADDSLVESGVIDSAGVLELVEFIEERFGVSIPFEDLVPEHFDTIRSVTSYVASRTGAASDGGG
jgi:acyl carrier protein